MAAQIRTNVTRTTTHAHDGNPEVSATTQTERKVEEAPVSGSVLAARVVSYILGVIEVILAFRFVLSLLGANRSNEFAQLVFNISNPLVQPFFGLFGYTPTYGASHMEMYTLVAMAVYAIIAWGIIALIRLPRGNNEVE
jgi:hypothetical protein